MTRLSEREFKAMNQSGRRLLQRSVEFPTLKRFSVPITDRDVLEVGCGSGYGAQLLGTLKPRSYQGFDFMPEQVALARRRLPGIDFFVQDAGNMKDIPDASKDTLVIFGVLHHIPEWKAAVRECARVLRPGGEVYVEEPDGTMLDWFDRNFHWGHPVSFRLTELEAHFREVGFRIVKKKFWFSFGMYRLQKQQG
jgi:ubiquinone/menaquinone biosynthesis C-methylase UbiE